MSARHALGLLVTLASAAASPAPAGEASGTGEGSYVTVFEDTVELASGSTLHHWRVEGFVTAEPGSLFHATEQNCSGTDSVAPGGAAVVSAGYCDGTDEAGDAWWIWFKGDRAGVVWGFLGGTGKFAGIEGGGSSRYVSRWPNGKFTTRWEGRWKTPAP